MNDGLLALICGASFLPRSKRTRVEFFGATQSASPRLQIERQCGGVLIALLTILCVGATSVAQATTIRVNTGGPAYTDSLGNVWSADTGFNTGTPASFGSQAISGTDDDELYQTERWDDGASPEMQYSFAVPNGTYAVKLHFAENAFNATGVRVFSVAMEGVTRISNLDVFATVGAHTALVTTTMVTVTDGQLDIGFIHDIEDPMVDAIEVSDAPTIRVNTGGAAYTDAAGNTWSADTGFNTGTAASFGSQAIAGTDDDVLYQTERWDDGASPEMQYSFTVPNGAYQVKLHFAENAFSATGVRVFSVDMEGTRQITDLDVFATVGAHAALVTTSLVRVADGQLNIGFVHNVEDPMIDAIEILPQTSGTPVPRYEVFELELTSSQTYSNPFTDVAVTATFSGPSNQQVTAQGFYDGGNTWRVRFAPDEIGTWTYVTDSDDNANSGLNAQSGTFNCVTQNNPAPVSNHGFIKVDPARKYYFQFSDGTPFYGVGDTAYGLPNGISDEQLDDYLDLRKSQGFNFIRFFASGFPFRVNGDTYAGPIQRSDGLPWQDASDSLWSAQLTRPNVAYFQRLDGILAKLKQRGMYAEVEVFNYYSPPFHYTDLWTTEVETIWAKYVVSRLSAYSSVFLWTVTNEYEIYPSNQYPPACSVHTPGDDDDVWADDMGNLFHSFDAHGHPTTVHNVTFDSDGGVGQRFGEATGIDVITHQRWGPDNPADFTNCPSLVDPNRIEQTLTVDSGYDKPVINTENGYEYAPGDTAGVSTDHVRQAAWRVFVGGGATLAAGFGNTWLGTDNVGGTLDGPDFEGGELGASDQITHLANFIAGIDYHNMGTAHNLVDNNNLVFRKTGVEYIVYAPAGGSFDLNLSGVPGTFSVEWFNPRTGGTSAGSNVSGGSSLSFTSPDSNDWVLHLVAL